MVSIVDHSLVISQAECASTARCTPTHGPPCAASSVWRRSYSGERAPRASYVSVMHREAVLNTAFPAGNPSGGGRPRPGADRETGSERAGR